MKLICVWSCLQCQRADNFMWQQCHWHRVTYPRCLMIINLHTWTHRYFMHSNVNCGVKLVCPISVISECPCRVIELLWAVNRWQMYCYWVNFSNIGVIVWCVAHRMFFRHPVHCIEVVTNKIWNCVSFENWVSWYIFCKESNVNGLFTSALFTYMNNTA